MPALRTAKTIMNDLAFMICPFQLHAQAAERSATRISIVQEQSLCQKVVIAHIIGLGRRQSAGWSALRAEGLDSR
jgi:hypothetical protein